MKLITVILCVLALLGLAVWAHARMNMTTVGGGPPAAATAGCSGDFTSGDLEDFEKGAGEFCTTDWTLTGSSNLDLYNTTYAKCGTHSLQITSSGNGSNRAVADIGSSVTSFSMSFYVRTPSSFPMYTDLQFLDFCSDSSRSTCQRGVMYYRSDGNSLLGLTVGKGGGADFIDDGALSTSTEYRIDVSINIAAGQDSTLKLYNSSGSQVGSTVTINEGVGATTRYIIISDFTGNVTGTVHYIDSAKYSGTTTPPGAVTCP